MGCCSSHDTTVEVQHERDLPPTPGGSNKAVPTAERPEATQRDLDRRRTLTAGARIDEELAEVSRQRERNPFNHQAAHSRGTTSSRVGSNANRARSVDFDFVATVVRNTRPVPEDDPHWRVASSSGAGQVARQSGHTNDAFNCTGDILVAASRSHLVAILEEFGTSDFADLATERARQSSAFLREAVPADAAANSAWGWMVDQTEGATSPTNPSS